MKHLGALRGHGQLTVDGEAIGAAEYDIDGYLMSNGEVVASGEIRMAPAELEIAFGHAKVKLVIEEGNSLSVRFTAKRLKDASEAAHADFSGDLPAQFASRR